eukprot:CAMPEP_0202713532 /NCGR_PEP_ID=MMETSP1385-20130828/55663_1 /ASSEMBLY_ACC=CAM_ASM_000861 /TAXON_ID=933848 /ORGANISM="Elphidium margaritaceum" /LENGTH=274 /DNA_ID=CAMNT_0049373911 /DNA_START=23 /DNA_END=847 /DNA_ORIENTATION=-
MTHAAQSQSIVELRRHGLAVYKELLKYTKVHPNPVKKQKYLKQIRSDFRRYAPIEDATKLDQVIKKATSRLGYIRMEIPAQLIPLKYRMQNLRDLENLHTRSGSTTLSVDSDGEIAASISTLITKARFSNWCDGNNDPDEKRKNDSLIERWNYRGPYWEKRRKGWLPQEAVDLWSGPGVVEALSNREKYDIGFDLPSEHIEEHPDVKGHMPSLATRKDFGLEEPDVVEMKVKRKKEPDPEKIVEGMGAQLLCDEKHKAGGGPNVLEFLKGKRDS